MLRSLRPAIFVSARDGGCLGGNTNQIVKFNGGYTLVYARDDLLGDSSCINVLGVEAITESRDTGSDLVELHAFFASVCTRASAHVQASSQLCRPSCQRRRMIIPRL